MQEIEWYPGSIVHPKISDAHHLHREQRNDEAVEYPSEEGKNHKISFVRLFVKGLHDQSRDDDQHTEAGDLRNRPRPHPQQKIGQDDRQDGHNEAIRHAHRQRQNDQHSRHRLDVGDELENDPPDIAQSRQDGQQRDAPDAELRLVRSYISVRFQTISSPSWSTTSLAPTIDGSPFTSNNQYFAFVSADSSTWACPSIAVMNPSASSME